MRLLDFAKMKKVASDDKTTTFKHDAGHEVKIFHGALPKIQREQIKRLPTYDVGGAVQKPEDQVDPGQVQPSDSTPAPPAHNQPIYNIINAGTPASSQAAPANAPSYNESSPISDTSPQDVAQVPAQAVNLGTKAANEQEEIDQAKAIGQVPIQEAAIANAKAIQDRQNQSIADFKSHTDAFANYLNENPQNSRRILQNQSDSEKYQTSLGLVLGGLGGGFQQNGSNVAMDFLNKTIDRDINDQKANADKHQTIYGAYQNLYGDENISTALTKVSMNDKLMADANLLTAKLGTPQAQANRDALVSKLQQDNYKNLQDAAGYASNPGPSGSGAQTPGASASWGSPNQMLSQDYKNKLNALKFGPYKDQVPDVIKQVTSADQAQKAMGAIDDAFPNLVNEATVRGRLARSVNPHAVAAAGAGIGTMLGGPGVGTMVGTAVGEGVGHLPAMTANIGNDKNKAYESDKNVLTKTIAKLVPNLSTEAIENAVNTSSPEQGDTPELIEKKKNNLKELIRNSVETSMLRQHGLLNAP